MPVGGGKAIGDIDRLRHQDQVLGPVASVPTVRRVLDELTPAVLKRSEVARAKVRRHVWTQVPKLPASQVADTDLVTSHNERKHAAPTFKGGFGSPISPDWVTERLLGETLLNDAAPPASFRMPGDIPAAAVGASPG